MFCIIMASHFKWYPAESEVVVPFNARYAFPSQANKAMKMTPRIPPKNASEFSPGNVIRLEFPAQGYVNPGKTTLEFDVELQYDPADNDLSYVRFQNNIQSIFSRVRLLYGATPIEDIPSYNVIIRQLTEWTGSQGMDQYSISEGIGGTVVGDPAPPQEGLTSAVTLTDSSAVNVRQAYIQGVDMTVGPGSLSLGGAAPNITFPTLQRAGRGKVPNAGGNSTKIDKLANAAAGEFLHGRTTKGYPTRRYQVQLMLGVFQQEKLIPTKFMASQLSIEITLENANACMYYRPSVPWATGTNELALGLGTPGATSPTYVVKHVNLLPEILEFDASYDETFLRGLQTGGVPIKFCTWNNFKFSQNGISSLNFQIQERSRSVKSIFCVQRREPISQGVDSGACFFNSNTATAGGASTLQEFQFRIGGRYFPAQPVQCSTEVGGVTPNGGCEAYTELAKAINTLGDARLSAPLNTLNFATNPGSVDTTINSNHTVLPEYDYDYAVTGYKYSGSPIVYERAYPGRDQGIGSYHCGNQSSGCFAMAIDLETSNGLEISGLNAEEQSDISLIARYSHVQQAGFVFDVFTYIDSMIVLRENNVLELIQ